MVNSVPTLYILNRNYSSWSLRAWLVMRYFKLNFNIELLLLGTPEIPDMGIPAADALMRRAGPTSKVPALHVEKPSGEHHIVFESLAILEYLAEGKTSFLVLEFCLLNVVGVRRVFLVVGVRWVCCQLRIRVHWSHNCLLCSIIHSVSWSLVRNKKHCTCPFVLLSPNFTSRIYLTHLLSTPIFCQCFPKFETSDKKKKSERSG